MPILVNCQQYKSFVKEVCLVSGLREEDAEITSTVLVENDKMGIFTHGTFQLYNYVKKIKAGGIDPLAIPEVISSGPTWAIMNAHTAIGMVAGWKAMEIAIQKAEKIGLSYVGISNSSHFGTCAYYALMAARCDMMSIVMSNTIKLMAAPGSKGPVIGNSPIGYALPAKKHYPVFLDVATSSINYTKIIQAKQAGKKVPEGWIVDSEGRSTTDPNTPGHTLVPFAGHKGYGFAVLIEALSGVLANGAILGEVCQDGMKMLDTPFGVSHAFIVLNSKMILGEELVNQRIDQMIDEIINSPKAEDDGRIYMPGEIELERSAKAEINGMELPDNVISNMKAVAELLGVKALILS